MIVLIVGFASLAWASTVSPFWIGYNGTGDRPWQWPGPDTSCGYWVNQTQDVVATMQNTFWNGSYWPTIQWIGAVVDTILAAIDETLTDALTNPNETSSTSHTNLISEVETYYADSEVYFSAEDTTQIFDAAYDDVQWVVLEWLEVIKSAMRFDNATSSNLPTTPDNITDFAHRAHVFYNVVQDKYNTSQCDGGLTWNPALLTYKNAITNTLFIATSIGMYLYWPGDNNNTDPYPNPSYLSQTNNTLPPLPPLTPHAPSLLTNAQKEYTWFTSHNFTNAQGLIVDGFHISAGQTSCDQRNEMVYTYNQGVILSGLRGLWDATGDSTYLTDAYALVDTVINATGWNAASASAAATWSGLGRNGIMEDYCDAAGSCSQDDLIFKGAYFQHLTQLCAPLPTSTPLVPGLTFLATPSLAAAHAQQCTSYAPWIMHNARAALATRNSTEVIGEWWGAAYLNQTNGPPVVSGDPYAVSLPTGSIDIRNQPWLLTELPWSDDTSPSSSDPARRAANHKRAEASVQVYSVETQAQGLAVVKAAADVALEYQT